MKVLRATGTAAAIVAASAVGAPMSASGSTPPHATSAVLPAAANGDSPSTAGSRHGRYVAFQSAASNLVPADTNGASDIFVRDLRTSRTTRVSVSSSGRQSNGDSVNPTMTAGGRYIVFESQAT